MNNYIYSAISVVNINIILLLSTLSDFYFNVLVTPFRMFYLSITH